MSNYKIVTVDASNVDELGIFCVKNRNHLGYIAKLSWLKERLKTYYKGN